MNYPYSKMNHVPVVPRRYRSEEHEDICRFLISLSCKSLNPEHPDSDKL